jgi:transposase
MNSRIPTSGLKSKAFIGIDVHLSSYAVCVVEEGRHRRKWTMPAEPEKLIEKLHKEYPTHEITTGYEAGFSGFVLHRALEAAGIRSIVVHAASVAVKTGDRVKTDRRDAQKLAEQLAAGMLSGVRIPTIEEELRRQLSRVRQQLMRDRVRVMVQIRRRLYHFWYLRDYEGILRRKDIRALLEKLPANELSVAVQSQYRLWESLERKLSSINKQLAQQARECSLDALYQRVPGIGRVSARILANELGDLQQFRSQKALYRFVGLTPSEHSSGERVRRGGISRQGNSLLRKILVEAAWVAIRKDSGLRKFNSQLAARSGGKKAIVAVARKLIGRARAVLRSKEEYREAEPLVA